MSPSKKKKQGKQRHPPPRYPQAEQERHGAHEGG